MGREHGQRFSGGNGEQPGWSAQAVDCPADAEPRAGVHHQHHDQHAVDHRSRDARRCRHGRTCSFRNRSTSRPTVRGWPWRSSRACGSWDAATHQVIGTVFIDDILEGNTATLIVPRPATPPDPPTGLYVASVAGNQVTLRWAPSAGGTPPTSYVVEGGLSPGEVLASLATGSASPIYSFAAPNGAFYVRVRARSLGASSSPSNEVRLFVNTPTPPSPSGRSHRARQRLEPRLDVEEHLRGRQSDLRRARRHGSRHVVASARPERAVHLHRGAAGHLHVPRASLQRRRRERAVKTPSR